MNLTALELRIERSEGDRRVRSAGFRRLLRLMLPHRRLLGIGLLAAVVGAAFHSVSIGGALPVMKVLIEEESLHLWTDRAIAEARLGAELELREWDPSPHEAPVEERDVLVLAEIEGDGPLAGLAGHGGDYVVAWNGLPPDPRAWLAWITAAPAGATGEVGVQPLKGGAPVAASVRLRDLAAHWKAVRFGASLLPRDETPAGRVRVLASLLAALVVVVIIDNATRFLAQYFIALGVFRGAMELRHELYDKVLRLPMAFFTRDVGDIVARFVQDIQEIQRGLLAVFGRLVTEPLKAAGILVVAVVLDWRVTVTMIIVGPPAVFIFWAIGRAIRKANQKLLRGYGTMIGAVGTTLRAINVVKAYTSEDTERLRLRRIDRQMFHQQVSIARLEAAVSPTLEVLGVIGIAAATVWLGSRVFTHELAPAKFLALVMVLATMFDPIRKVADVYGRVQRASAAADRIFSVIDAAAEEHDAPGAPDLPEIKTAIEYRDVTFTYPEANVAALDRVNLTVRRGETVAVVGPNGAGKTTLVHMLTRFYDPDDGAILIEGLDIRTVKLRSLRRQISLVTQDAVVFAASMTENIAYGSRNVDEQAVRNAAVRAGADDFITAMPQGYDTVAGESGVTLSGGQRQRISIARAILRNAPILIFDEATSQIDAESEKRIQNALREFAVDRTTFIVAHRLSTIKFARRIIVMDAGRIIDAGAHDELLARCPLYHALCQTQLVH